MSVGKLAPVSQTVDPYLGLPQAGLCIATVLCITWSVFKQQKWHKPF
jgi:hypothetical protein